jgi:hypothetical protein
MTGLYTLGRRVERLLYLGVAVVAASLFSGLLSGAIEVRNRVEMKDALQAFAREIEETRSVLQSEYDDMRARSAAASKNAARRSAAVEALTNAASGRSYEDHLRLLATFATIDISDRRDAVVHFLTDTVSPALSIDENLARISAKKNEAIEPLRVLGVEIPRNVKVSVVGQELSIPLQVLSHALAVILGPLLILWLGSLYATRIREIHLLRTCKDMTESFPHILNQFPLLTDIPWQGRFAKLLATSPRVNRYATTGVRILIVLLMSAPAIWGYVNSLREFLDPHNFAEFMIVLMVIMIVGFQGLALVIAEIIGGWFRIEFGVSIKDLAKKP